MTFTPVSYTHLDVYKRQVYEMPYEILFENIHQLKVMIITLLAVFLVLALIISMFWIYAITKPLNSLIAAMRCV